MRAHNPLGWISALPVFLIDDDIVESKNLVRQNFIEQDVGKYKSVVMAERYSQGFGIPLYPLVGRVDDNLTGLPSLQFPTFTGATPYQNIVLIMAVDSPAARRDILKYFFRNASTDTVFVIDAGNEDNFGQVKFFTKRPLLGDERGKQSYFQSLPKMVPEPFPVKYIPFPANHYTNLGSSASEKSCADLDQTLAINSIMATIMCGILQNFLYIKPMNYHEIRYSLNGAISTVFNTPANWLSDVGGNTWHSTEFAKNIRYQDALALDYLKGFGVATEYRNHIVQKLDAMGLTVTDLGELLPKPKPAQTVAIEGATKPTKFAPVKRVRRTPVNPLLVPVDMSEDIQF